MKHLLLFFYLVCSLAGHTQSTITFSGDSEIIGSKTVYLIDKINNLSWNEVIAQRSSFVPIGRDVFSHPPSTSTVWMMFELRNNSGEDLWLDIYNSNLNDIRFYKLSLEGTLLDSIVTGTSNTQYQRHNSSHTFWLPIAERNDSLTHLYLLSFNTDLVMEVPLYIGLENQLSSIDKNTEYFALIMIGGILLMFFYNLALYFKTKLILYFYYSLTLFFLLFFSTFTNNFPIIKYIIGSKLAFEHVPIWTFPLFISQGLFAIEYLNIKKRNPIAYKIILLELLIFFLFIPLNIFIDLSNLALPFLINVLIFNITYLILGYVELYRGNPRAKLFCLGWTFVVVGLITFVLTVNGVTPYSPFLRHINYIGILLEIFIFAIALGQIINELSNRHELLNIELHRKNQELSALNESLDSFNYHISHDLKTVMNNCSSLSSMIIKYTQKKDYEKVTSISQRLASVTIKGSETIESFLSLGELDFIDSSTSQLISVKEQIQELLATHELEDKIEIQVFSDDNQVNIPLKMFNSIFLNLITNTIKYNNGKPKAEITLKQSNTHSQWMYQDNGIGIDMEKDGASLFKPYIRIQNDKKAEGTGVGLYLLKRMITNYGGAISLSSKLGQGVQINIDLPNK